jgi:hypothetical protein
MSDIYDQVATHISNDTDGSVEDVAAILRGAFPEPAPAEQGEGDALDAYAGVYGLLADMKPRFEEVEAVTQELFRRYFITPKASRPQPEANADEDEDYSTLLERHIRELRNFAARCEARLAALEKE